MNDLSSLLFSIVGLFVCSYLYYDMEDFWWRMCIFVNFTVVLSFCFGISFGNRVTDLNWQNGITLAICAFSLEENTAFLIRKLKKHIKAQKEKKKEVLQTND